MWPDPLRSNVSWKCSCERAEPEYKLTTSCNIPLEFLESNRSINCSYRLSIWQKNNFRPWIHTSKVYKKDQEKLVKLSMFRFPNFPKARAQDLTFFVSRQSCSEEDVEVHLLAMMGSTAGTYAFKHQPQDKMNSQHQSTSVNTEHYWLSWQGLYYVFLGIVEAFSYTYALRSLIL